MIKKCKKCGNIYPATMEYFYLNKQGKNGLSSRCKDCVRVASAYWRDKHTEYQKEYYHKTIKGNVSCLVNSIKQRCTNENCKQYKNYGGRGIKCEFTANEFFAWIAFNNIDPRGLSIHRINNNENYTLSNIEFLTKEEHARLHRLEKVKMSKI